MNNYKIFLKSYLGILLPSTITTTVALLIMMIRSIMVADYGVDILAGVAFIYTISIIIDVVLGGLFGVFSNLYAINFGKQDNAAISYDFQQSNWFVIFCSLISALTSVILLLYINCFSNLPIETKTITNIFLGFSFVTRPIGFYISNLFSLYYCVGKAKLAAKISIVFTIIEFIIQIYILFGIFGYGKLGPYYMQLGSFINLLLELTVILYITKTSSAFKKYKLFTSFFPKINFQRLKYYLAQGLLMAGSNLGEMLIFAIGSFALISFGTGQISLNQVLIYFADLIIIIQLKSSSAVSIIFGRLVGSKDIDNAKRSFIYGIYTQSVIVLIIAAIILFFRDYFAVYYFPNDLYLQKQLSGFLYLALGLGFFNGFNYISNFCLRVVQDTKFAFYVNTILFFGFGLPLAFYVPHLNDLGAIGYFLNLNFFMLLSSIFLIVRMFRYLRMDNQKIINIVETNINQGKE